MEIRPILSALLRSKTGAILVALQVAISLAILTNALHIVGVRQAVAARPTGIAGENSVFYIRVRHLVEGSHQQQIARQQSETQALRAIGGVASAAFASQAPISRSGWTTSLAATRTPGADTSPGAMYYSSDSLVDTWGLKLVQGRDLRPDDVVDIDGKTSPEELFPKSVLMTRALAGKLWPGAAGVLGKTVYFGTSPDGNAATVVGVIDTLQTQNGELAARGDYALIVPIRQSFSPAMYTVRAEAGQLDRVMKEAEATLRASNQGRAIITMQTAAADRKERYRADMALSWMLIAVSVLLLLITASGIVGMASLWVTQRRKQIGVRRALGARRTDILRYFITENFMITSVGVLCGVALSVALNQLLVSRLEMARLPLAYLAVGAGVFWALGVAAVYGPAWRAASISPATATRSA
ncbi:FtsX-like permease family protein [Massilia atriviolacea]|uniref:FtsX-like permease family protein n=1 Tax=Massilia atriviolacea TaxID=2495579 RepID=A0A430HE71_9BURK|nr:FtsX-like permease family protein [Massilia atriviolacea]RSZ55777.1 FtsX-like permease family protein [Massilia atriviolacea]